MLIREAAERDCGAIAEVHVASWRSTYRGQIPDDYLDALSVPKRSEMWKQVLSEKEGKLLVLENSGTINGFVSFGPSRDHDASASRGEIYAIYLVAKAQSIGAGRALWEAATRDLQGSGFLELSVWVFDSNLRARSFYEKMGCTLDGASKKESVGGREIEELRYLLSLKT